MKQTTPYCCKEHDFYTTDPTKATKHIQGHIVGLVFDLAENVVRARLGIPQDPHRQQIGAVF